MNKLESELTCLCWLCVQKELENLQDAEDELLMLDGDDEGVPYP